MHLLVDRSRPLILQFFRKIDRGIRRREDVVHAGNAEAPFASVDFSLATGQRGRILLCTYSRRWHILGEVSFLHPSRRAHAVFCPSNSVVTDDA